MADTKQRQCKNCGYYETDPDAKTCPRCGSEIKMYVVTNPDNPPAAQAVAQARAEQAPHETVSQIGH